MNYLAYSTLPYSVYKCIKYILSYTYTYNKYHHVHIETVKYVLSYVKFWTVQFLGHYNILTPSRMFFFYNFFIFSVFENFRSPIIFQLELLGTFSVQSGNFTFTKMKRHFVQVRCNCFNGQPKTH